jgi:hypothetical protein
MQGITAKGNIKDIRQFKRSFIPDKSYTDMELSDNFNRTFTAYRYP